MVSVISDDWQLSPVYHTDHPLKLSAPETVDVSTLLAAVPEI